MSTRGAGNQIAVVLLAGCALLAALVARFALPERFLRDDNHLQLAMDPHTAYLTADSFQAVGSIYRWLGLQDAAPIAALLAVGIFVGCVFAAVGWERLRDAQMLDLLAIYAALVIGVVYLGQYSKELVTLLVGALVLLLPRGRVGDAALILVCVSYGGVIRDYWLLIGALYLMWRVVLPLTRRPILLLLPPVLAYAALQPVFRTVFGGGLQIQRSSVNGIRENLDAVGSLIQSPLPDVTGPVGILAALLMVLMLVVPLPLLLSPSAYYLFSALLVMGIWTVVLLPLARGRLAVPHGITPSRAQIVAIRSAALLLSLLMVQALFEPDYGSYLKHLTPLLPLALTLLPASLQNVPHAKRDAAPPITADRCRDTSSRPLRLSPVRRMPR